MIKEIKELSDNIYYIDIFYDNEKNKNYIITTSLHFTIIFDYGKILYIR